MPKPKTHSGTKDRFRVTRKGKVVHARQNKNHILEKKSAARKRRLSRNSTLSGKDAKQVTRLLNGH